MGIRRKKVSRSIGGDIFVLMLVFGLGLLMVIPFIYTIMQSLKPVEELFAYPPRFYVKKPTLDNFYMVTQLTGSLWVPVSRYVFNSVFVTVLGTVGHVILSSMAAFPLAKYRYPGSKWLFHLVTVCLLFTSQVTGITNYIIMAKMDILNTLWAVLLPSLAAPLGLFLMKQFMQSIPDALIEAATVDGAGTFKIFLRIIMPNVKPAWLTLTIFSFQTIWNNDGLAYVYDEEMKNLPAMLQQIVSTGLGRAGAGAAIAVILMIPPLAVFIISQSNVIETMSHSGIKE